MTSDLKKKKRFFAFPFENIREIGCSKFSTYIFSTRSLMKGFFWSSLKQPSVVKALTLQRKRRGVGSSDQTKARKGAYMSYFRVQRKAHCCSFSVIFNVYSKKKWNRIT